jgi:hypothetical protein
LARDPGKVAPFLADAELRGHDLDPMYMIMLIKNLSPDYIVWDKAASIRFKRPGKGTLFARFLLDEEELTSIKVALENESSVDRIYHVDLVDRQGIVHAEVEKIIYISKPVIR